jgi:hypothetical protein
VWHVKEPSQLKAVSAKHRSKFAAPSPVMVTYGGDVDMFGYEDGTPLAIKKEILEVEKRSLKSITQNIDIYEQEN